MHTSDSSLFKTNKSTKNQEFPEKTEFFPKKTAFLTKNTVICHILYSIKERFLWLCLRILNKAPCTNIPHDLIHP